VSVVELFPRRLAPPDTSEPAAMCECVNRPDERTHPTAMRNHRIDRCNAGAINVFAKQLCRPIGHRVPLSISRLGCALAESGIPAELTNILFSVEALFIAS
jgi:hypothetical protein